MEAAYSHCVRQTNSTWNYLKDKVELLTGGKFEDKHLVVAAEMGSFCTTKGALLKGNGYLNYPYTRVYFEWDLTVSFRKIADYVWDQHVDGTITLQNSSKALIVNGKKVELPITRELHTKAVCPPSWIPSLEAGLDVDVQTVRRRTIVERAHHFLISAMSKTGGSVRRKRDAVEQDPAMGIRKVQKFWAKGIQELMKRSGLSATAAIEQMKKKHPQAWEQISGLVRTPESSVTDEVTSVTHEVTPEPISEPTEEYLAPVYVAEPMYTTEQPYTGPLEVGTTPDVMEVADSYNARFLGGAATPDGVEVAEPEAPVYATEQPFMAPIELEPTPQEYVTVRERAQAPWQI
jgi:hypothetical protein